MADKSKLGTEFPAFTYEVEKGKIAEFVMAISQKESKDQIDQIYASKDAAKKDGYDDIVISPTFQTCFALWGGGGLMPMITGLGINLGRLLHGEEEIAFGDSAYASKERSLEADREEGDVVWATPFKRRKGQDLSDEQRRINRYTSSFRSKVEHVFRIVKRQFGYTKTRYRGLYKNSQQIFCLLALANIYIMREKLPEPAG